MPAIRLHNIMFWLAPVFAALLLLPEDSCWQRLRNDGADPAEPQVLLGYNLGRPDTVFALPGSLREISGLTCRRSSLLAVEDENARVFTIDPSTGASSVLARFGPDGDYEGIEAVGDTIFVLRSDGTLFRMRADNSDKWKHDKVESDITRKSEWEGLGYDPVAKTLLIAEKNGRSKSRRVVEYNLGTDEWLDRPAVEVSQSSINSALKDAGMRAQKFRPSAIALNPVDGLIYMLSSTPSTLLVVDSVGNPVGVQVLRDRRIRQPEGICFMNDGRLFLSSEANGDRARLFVYSPATR